MITSRDKWTDRQRIADAYINNIGAVYGSDGSGEMKPGCCGAVLHTDVVVQPCQTTPGGAFEPGPRSVSSWAV